MSSIYVHAVAHNNLEDILEIEKQSIEESISKKNVEEAKKLEEECKYSPMYFDDYFLKQAYYNIWDINMPPYSKTPEEVGKTIEGWFNSGFIPIYLKDMLMKTLKNAEIKYNLRNGIGMK